MKKNILCFILGLVVAGSVAGVVAYNYDAKDIRYTPSDGSWNVNNVGDAIKDLKHAKGGSQCDGQWTKVDNALLTGSPAYGVPSLYKCNSLCRISFSIDGHSMNTEYKMILDEKYYPKEEFTTYGMGGSYGYSRIRFKTDGNIVVIEQSRSSNWATVENLIYICE